MFGNIDLGELAYPWIQSYCPLQSWEISGITNCNMTTFSRLVNLSIERMERPIRTKKGQFRKRSTRKRRWKHEAPKSWKPSIQISKTKQPKIENEAPKTLKRTTQTSKPVCPLKTRDSPLQSHQQHATSLCTMLLCACHRPIFNLFHDVLFLSEKTRFRPVGDVFVYKGIEGGFRGYFGSVLGASFSSFGCFALEIWVLCFRDLGASCFGLCFQVLRFRNYPKKDMTCSTFEDGV